MSVAWMKVRHCVLEEGHGKVARGRGAAYFSCFRIASQKTYTFSRNACLLQRGTDCAYEYGCANFRFCESWYIFFGLLQLGPPRVLVYAEVAGAFFSPVLRADGFFAYSCRFFTKGICQLRLAYVCFEALYSRCFFEGGGFC